MKIGLSWIGGKKEYRYAGMSCAHAENEREAVDIEDGCLVYTRTFPEGGDGVAIVGYMARPDEPVAPIGDVLPVSHGAIPLTVTVHATREVVATAEDLEQLDGIEVEGDAGQRWVRGATGLRYAKASDDGSSDDGNGERSCELDGPGHDDGLGGFSDIFKEMQREAEMGGLPTDVADGGMSEAERLSAIVDRFGLGR